MKLATKVYEQTAQNSQANTETTSDASKDKKDDVEEASYEEK